MRKRTGAVVLAFAALFLLAACGDKSQETEIEGPVAEKYHQMMDVEKDTYYLESQVTEEFLKEDTEAEPVTSVSGEAIDGDHKAYLFGESELTDKQIVIGDRYYNLSQEEKTYYISNDVDEVFEPEFDRYVKSMEVEYEGKIYRYDQYEDRMNMTSYSEDEKQPIEDEVTIYVKKYVVDDTGKLTAIVYENRDDGEESAFYRRVDKVTRLQEGSVPKGIFEIPKNYKKIEEGEDDPMLE